MRECDDGFVVGDGSLWVHVMSVEYRNAVGKVAYTLFYTTCLGFVCVTVCLSGVSLGTDSVGQAHTYPFPTYPRLT